MKTILVPVEINEPGQFTLRLAGLIANLFDSSIEGFALRMLPVAALGWDPASVAIINSSTWDESHTVADARALFESVMGEARIAIPAGEGAGMDAGGATWRWNDTATAGDDFLGSYGRAFDLTVVGQPSSPTLGASITTLEAALFDSGGPILIAPPQPVVTLGERIVIAWNGSSETARTIAFAMPFLKRARQVTILADDGGLKHSPGGEMIRRRLERNAIPVDLKLLPGGAIRSGEAILGEASALGCDLLVKGAYTQSRLRQMIFGGATNHVLAQAKIPVFMAH